MPARHTDIHMYPPVPIIRSGLNSFIIFLDSPIEPIVFNNLFIFFTLKLLDIPYDSIVFNSYPALGTNFVSNPFCSYENYF